MAANGLWLCEDFRLRMRNLSDKPKTKQVQTKHLIKQIATIE